MRRCRIELCNLNFPLKKKKINKNSISDLTYYKSFFWCSFPCEVGIYIIKEFDKNLDYQSLFFNSMCPEEEFWATMIMNSKYKTKVKRNHTLVYTLEFINNHPKTLTINNVNLLNESDCLFARKFDINIDEEVIEYYKKLVLGDRIK